MKLILFVEGETERYLPEFFQRWVNPRLKSKIAIKAIKFSGVGDYRKNISSRVPLLLERSDIIGAIGLIDLYGSDLGYPDGSTEEKYSWAKSKLETQVGQSRFRQHFAVYETEAWLLSDPTIFPAALQDHLPKTERPETINFQNPPSQRLRSLYQQKLTKKYQKPIEGSRLFRALDPQSAYDRCPHLQLLLNDILELAKSAA